MKMIVNESIDLKKQLTVFINMKKTKLKDNTICSNMGIIMCVQIDRTQKFAFLYYKPCVENILTKIFILYIYGYVQKKA